MMDALPALALLLWIAAPVILTVIGIKVVQAVLAFPKKITKLEDRITKLEKGKK